MLSVNTLIHMPRMSHAIFEALRDALQVKYSKHGTLYAEITLCRPKTNKQTNKQNKKQKQTNKTKKKKDVALQNQRYLWFESMDFLNFFTNHKQEHSLKAAIKFDLLV